MDDSRTTLPVNVILLGDPAAGKATQAERLVARYSFLDLDMGREVRKASVRKLYDYSATTQVGRLTPTQVVRDILKRAIFKTKRSQGILFDGTPKMPGEARLVHAWLKQVGRLDPLVIYLSIPVKESLQRMEGRSRADDTTAALKNRIAYYKDSVAKTVLFFKKKYSFAKISGMGTPDEVEAKIISALEKFINAQKRIR